MSGRAFQDQMRDNFCFGCGADNPDGLQIKSFWDGDEAVCRFEPLPHHAAGPRHILNGGIIATIIDCHTVCSAMADAYRREAREIGSAPDLWYATGNLVVSYKRPTPIDQPIELIARILEVGDRRTTIDCRLIAAERTCVEGQVEAIRVPSAWRHGAQDEK